MGFVHTWTPNYTTRLGWKRRGPGTKSFSFKDEEAVGQGSQIDASLLAETHPVGIGINAAGCWGEKVAPMTRVFGIDERAVAGMRARCNDVEAIAELIAQHGEIAADGMGARLDPEDGLRLMGEREQFGTGCGSKLVEHVAEYKQTDGFIGRKMFGLETWKFPLCRLEREIARQRRMIPDQQPGETLDAKSAHHTTSGDAAAATPVEDREAGRRRPTTSAELGEYGVPFPTDPFAVGKIVICQIVERRPIRPTSGVATEKPVA